MAKPNTKPRGRPKGSKNKRTGLSASSVQQICEFNKFNPAQKLIDIANGTASDEAWNKNDKLRATEKLFDAIHNKRGVPGVDDGSSDGQQSLELVFIEAEGNFQLPREIGSEVAAREYGES